ncbi:NAD(P)H-binding protein [Flavobacterium sp. F-380]|uniref:NAD(P)H-binding protein n=1 Tax=Flavobacterium kayseriense TaxID=2764714 RepID=A0ABR7JA33_9FLAO|nr:NAD(P)H-binding protein [Flavobacterium kayseriense]MBC5842384.1 NAD(P)H-binding protein [Flavobacterium kayseriense]MBC5848914.1 NAD(P)H-binding protein [Flavobacterium kayseriense]
MKTALIIGGTGLIGSKLLKLLLESSDYEKVIAFSKREMQLKHPKLVLEIIDFDKPESYANLVQGDDFFCTIGTTIKKAGSKEAFRKVDYQYPKQFATIALENGIKQFLLISSLGADEKSGNFYLKTKGEIQSFLKNSSFDSVSIVQPSLLLGDRKEFRFGEQVGAVVMKIFSFLLIGSLKKYKPIHGDTVAKALFTVAQKSKKGFTIYESDLLEQLGN